ncbi:homeobox protein BEL1-like protein [Pyrus ussuriensis x Pyrus communis]|uniref:Homeobox protein BEL1-like protein n=1 Tax=Pyrus ussuriensis x Pyrus communis TaxID=2448454 RepID=A0A5N5GD90_9ROSA|nr:homeobox protein BEL1-like protein [Pyrus ussuriensis x Pyrus communis]
MSGLNPDVPSVTQLYAWLVDNVLYFTARIFNFIHETYIINHVMSTPNVLQIISSPKKQKDLHTSPSSPSSSSSSSSSSTIHYKPPPLLFNNLIWILME